MPIISLPLSADFITADFSKNNDTEPVGGRGKVRSWLYFFMT
ncbi:hypothetical protein [Pseudomonas nunensis]|nr:hypothetical protein [Pseudomonas nunensis]MDN3221365.1 hypothetical protein [Pseudomonas nunensis]